MALILGIGTVVHIGEWSYTVESVTRDGVTARSADGRPVFISRKVVEDAVFGRKS